MGANLAALVVAFMLVWAPEVRQHWIGVQRVGSIDVAAARARPGRDLLEEIGGQMLAARFVAAEDRRSPERMRRLGEGVRAGEVTLLGQTSRLPFPFRASHLDNAQPAHQLPVASLATVVILLDAYAATNDHRFLDDAVTEAVAYASVDRWRVLPRGLLWNDHALATRIAVLSRLWANIRNDANLRDDDARAILALAERTVRRLATTELFTFRTNHGVMQNLALMQFAAAFPTLQDAAAYGRLGCDRLTRQMPYYIHREGPTLEHSAGYHEHGRAFIAIAQRLHALNGCVVPPEWPGKLAAATEFSRMMMRPDHTLPAIGDTDLAPWPAEDAVDLGRGPPAEFRVYNGAGFAISWQGLKRWPDRSALAQTVVTWSSFPSRAHKLGDDMSLALWARGRPWLTNTGYWPYGAAAQDDATGWRGSNAPHEPGEPSRAAVAAKLLATGEGPGLRVLDLQRDLPRGGAVRRQIVEIEGPTWIVLDSAVGTRDRTITRLWTTVPETKVEPVGAATYRLRASDTGETARLALLGDLPHAPHVAAGQRHPFAGWVVRDGRTLPAPSFEVRQSKAGSIAMVLALGEGADFQPRLDASDDPEQWQVTVNQAGGPITVTRRGATISVGGPTRASVDAAMVRAPSPEATNAAVIEAYTRAAATYPGPRYLLEYRYKLTLLLLLLVAGQEIVVFAAWRLAPRFAPALRLVAAGSWLAVGLLSYFWYLR